MSMTGVSGLVSGGLGILGALQQYGAGQTQAEAGQVGASAALLAGQGQAFEATAAGEAATYSAQVATNNAIIARYNAKEAEQAGYTQANVTALQAAATGGQVKAAQAANNIDVNTGSAVAVQEGTRQAGYLNTETVMNNAELAAYGYRTQQRGFTEQAGLEQLTAEQAPVAAGLATAGGEFAAAGAEYGSEGAMMAAEGSLLSSASGIGFKISGLNPLSSASDSGGTGLSGSNWSLNIPPILNFST
jgi:hypothetical protein